MNCQPLIIAACLMACTSVMAAKGESKMPMLKWAGKEKVVNHHNDVPFKVLERKWGWGKCCQCENVASTNANSQLGNDNIGNTSTFSHSHNENMIIHGDNLAALKALLPQYEGKVKCIYIDPPYNTGEEEWVSNDNVNDPQIKKWLGEVVGKEGEDFSRHDKWLCMMYPRLRLLQKLLSDDGTIFISIDDNEFAHLRLICDEIFGSQNFNGAGFSASDYRVAEAADGNCSQITIEHNCPQITNTSEVDLFDDIPDEGLLQNSQTPSSESNNVGESVGIDQIIDAAVEQGDEYEQSIKETADADLPILGGVEVKIQRMQSEFAAEAEQLEIPQFMVQDDAGLFGGDEGLVPLSETALLDGFTLAAKDAAVPFNLSLSGAVRVDISESGDVMPKCKQLSKSELEHFSAQLATKSTDDRLKALVEVAATQLDGKIDFCVKKEIVDYVNRVVQQLSVAVRDQLSLELLPSFVQCVKDKIDSLARQHKRSTFNEKINRNAVLCSPNYKLPQTIQPPSTVTYIEKSLYTGEYADMNSDEITVIQGIASKDNVKWWHRIRDRKGFCINGFLNHYPDFMVLTDKGNVVMVEVKGPHLDGSDSQAKAELGRIWADNAGQRFKYFMVFLKDGDAVQGALKIDAFLNTIEKL